MLTARRLARQILDAEEAAGALAYSALCRAAMLGEGELGEIEQVQEEAGDMPLLMAYGGTVFFPVQAAGRWNAHHETNALVLCLL